MLEWVKTLAWYEQILWFVAIIFTLLFFYQFILTFVRNQSKRQRNTISSYLLSFQNITAFFSMSGWVSIACIYQNFSLTATLIISVLCGFVMMAIMPVLFYYFRKMKENNTPEKPEKINSTGEVIEDIGRKRSNPGRIKINIDGIHKEMEAVTDFNHDIKKGTKIEVESVNENGMLIIKPLQ